MLFNLKIRKYQNKPNSIQDWLNTFGDLRQQL